MARCIARHRPLFFGHLHLNRTFVQLFLRTPPVIFSREHRATVGLPSGRLRVHISPLSLHQSLDSQISIIKPQLLSLRRLCVLCVSALSVAVDLLVLCFQKVTNPSFRNSRVFTSIQNPREWRHSVRLFASPTSPTAGRERQVTPFHLLAASFALFTPFSALASFCFQSFAASFQKSPGWGYLWFLKTLYLRKEFG